VKTRRLIWQIYPSYLAVTVAALAAAMLFSSGAIKRFYLEHKAQDLFSQSQVFKLYVADHLRPLDEAAIQERCRRAGRETGTRLTVVLADGRVVGDSEDDPARMTSHADRPEIIEALSTGRGQSQRFSRTLQQQMMYVAVPVIDADAPLAVVRVAVSVSALDRRINRIQGLMAAGGILGLALAAVICLAVSRRISRPIQELESCAMAFARGDFSPALPAVSTDELQRLAVAMHKMAKQLNERLDTVVSQRNEMQAVFASMVEGMMVLDRDQCIIRINPPAARILGVAPHEVRGRTVQEAVRSVALQNFVTRALNSETPLQADISLYRDGELLLYTCGSQLRDAGDTPVGVVLLLHDVTEVRRLETIRRDFAANVSHELKTPLTAIKGFVETLRHGKVDDPDEAARFLAIIEKHVNRLAAIIEDLMKLSRIEQDADSEAVNWEIRPLSEVVGSALRICQETIAAKQIQIKTNCPGSLSARVSKDLMEQALVNLIQNALTYSDPQSLVEITCERVDRDVVVHIKDQGIGIAAKHIPRIFERFYRVDKARSRKLGGTGLGLAIVKHIVGIHGGRIGVQSTLGQGSTFSIYLPG
jgi:two-component system phosphate regulon sensor histidine kinase PhoR